MDAVMLASLMDELDKIAANAAIAGTAIGKPASIPHGIASVTKPNTKPTNYSAVNTETRMAAPGTAASSKAVLPPPVRT